MIGRKTGGLHPATRTATGLSAVLVLAVSLLPGIGHASLGLIFGSGGYTLGIDLTGDDPPRISSISMTGPTGRKAHTVRLDPDCLTIKTFDLAHQHLDIVHAGQCDAAKAFRLRVDGEQARFELGKRSIRSRFDWTLW